MSRVRRLGLLFSLTAGCGSLSGPSDFHFEALDPDIRVSPTAYAYDGVVVPYGTPTHFKVINAGRADLYVDEVVIDGDPSGAFSVSDTEPFVLTADEQVELEVSFTPTTYEDFTARLRLVSNDPDSPETVVPLTGSGVDGPLPDLDLDPGFVDFGLVAVGTESLKPAILDSVGQADLFIESVEVVGSTAFSLQRPTTVASELIPAGQDLPLVIAYAPSGDRGDHAVLRIVSDDPHDPIQELVLLGNGGGGFQFPVADFDCPDSVDAPAIEFFDGRRSFDPLDPDAELAFEWTVLETPEDSSTTAFREPHADYTSLPVDLTGWWTVGLQVENEVGLRSAQELCRFEAIPPDEVHIELVWDTEADLDLHLVQGGADLYELPGDCNHCNQTPDWGPEGSAGDPTLALDDRTGYGPEVIRMQSPQDGDYRVIVDNFSANGTGETVATVRVFLNGMLAWEDNALLGHHEVWRTGFLRWPDAVFSVNDSPPELWEGGRSCE